MKPARLITLLALIALISPGCGPRKTPEQRLAGIRMVHEIVPVGTTTVHDADGNPVLVVDLRVTNKGTTPLPHLTVLIQVHAPDGTLKASKRATLNLSGARPGVGVQVAASLPGVAAADEDQVTVELESNLPPDVLRKLPEYHDLFPGGS